MVTTPNSHREPVAKETANVLAERLEPLQQLFPEAFPEGQIDWDQLRAALGDRVNGRAERYAFTWAGKGDAIRLLQTPSRATLVPAKEESVHFDVTQHLFLEGDNLEVLKLLYKPYFGRVKMTYIDPPYNTGNDFIYPDNYADPLDTYLRLTGQTDAAGNLLTSNPETSGRYHSAWLSMMYPRLFLARQLLREDGVIFVSIDDHEIHNLRMVMNEVFGEECFKNCLIFRRGIKSVQAQFDTVEALTVGHEYVVMYAKSPEARFRKLTIPLEEAKGGTWNNHWRGTDRPTMRYELLGITPTTGQWRWSQERSRQALANYQQMLQELEVREEGVTQQQIDEWYRQECEKRGEEIDLLRLSASGKPEHYVPPTDTKLGSDLWVDLSPRGSAELDALFGPKVFDNPKPVGLIRRMLDFITDPQGHDLVLDFFAGSCTTAQAVLELNHEDGGNRRFIMIQLPEPTGNPQFPTIADLGKERIRRVIARLKKELEGRLDLNDRETPEDLGFRAFRLAESHFRPWPDTVPPDADAYAAQMELFTDPLVEGWTVENVLYEVALKEGFGLNCRMERVESIQDHVVYRVTDPDKEQTFLICLDEEIELAALQPLHLAAEDLFIGRDRALDDETAANLALQCRLKTI